MDREDIDVGSLAQYRCRWTGRLIMFFCEISDAGSGNYEPVESQTLPPPATNYGATGR